MIEGVVGKVSLGGRSRYGKKGEGCRGLERGRKGVDGLLYTVYKI